jgi:hypothetical protein
VRFHLGSHALSFFSIALVALARRLARRENARVRSIAIRLIAVNLCVGLFVGTSASAHPEFSPASTNRYLKLTLLSPAEVRLAYTVLYGAGPASAARQAADLDRSGKLDDAESKALGTRLLADVQKGLTLTCDGKPATPVWETPAVGLLGADVGPNPFSVDLIARVPCAGVPPHELVLDDRTELPMLGETEVRAEESPATTLLAFHRGPSTNAGVDEKEAPIVFHGPKLSSLEDRSVTLRYTASATPTAAHAKERAPTRPALPWPVAVGAILLFGILGAFARRRR